MSTKKLGTYNFTESDSPLTIKENWGYTAFSIKCTSSTAIKVKGTAVISVNDVNKSSEETDVAENESFDWSEGIPIQDFTVIIPTGATCILRIFK